MDLAPLALRQPNYAKFREQQSYFMKSVRDSEYVFTFREKFEQWKKRREAKPNGLKDYSPEIPEDTKATGAL